MNSNRDSTYFETREPLTSSYRVPRNSNQSTSRYYLQNNVFVPPSKERIDPKALASNMSIINSYQQSPSKKTTRGLQYTPHHNVYNSYNGNLHSQRKLKSLTHVSKNSIKKRHSQYNQAQSTNNFSR